MRSIFRLLFIHLGRILFTPNSQHNVSVDTIKVWIQLKASICLEAVLGLTGGPVCFFCTPSTAA